MPPDLHFRFLTCGVVMMLPLPILWDIWADPVNLARRDLTLSSLFSSSSLYFVCWSERELQKRPLWLSVIILRHRCVFTICQFLLNSNSTRIQQGFPIVYLSAKKKNIPKIIFFFPTTGFLSHRAMTPVKVCTEWEWSHSVPSFPIDLFSSNCAEYDFKQMAL